ncbi:CRTAC1 family protein, partial [bacterium]
FVSNYVGPNGLYINDGTGKFAKADVKKIGLSHVGWGKGPSWGDVDNDGDLDLYEGDCKVSNQLYINNGKGVFTDKTAENPAVACSAVRSKGTAFADIDNDGDLDLYVINWAAPNVMALNNTNNSDFLKVKLTGTVSNHMAVGSRVWVRDGIKLVGMRDMETSSGFCSQPPQELHFGLSAAKTYTVEVRFPSGLRKVVENVKAGQTITIEEPGAVAKN